MDIYFLLLYFSYFVLIIYYFINLFRTSSKNERHTFFTSYENSFRSSPFEWRSHSVYQKSRVFAIWVMHAHGRNWI